MAMDAEQARDLDRDVEMAAHAHQRLLADLDRLVDDGELDMATPSRLPGWTSGHVIAHVWHSGEGHIGIFDAAMRGEVRDQYPHGGEGRDADIAAGAVLEAADIVERLRRSIWSLEGRWSTSNWEGKGVTRSRGDVLVRDLPFVRMREVSIHHVDLDIGYEFADLPERYVRLEIDKMMMYWGARRPMGLTQPPEPALRLPPPERLAWLMGRTVVDGLEPAGIF